MPPVVRDVAPDEVACCSVACVGDLDRATGRTGGIHTVPRVRLVDRPAAHIGKSMAVRMGQERVRPQVVTPCSESRGEDGWGEGPPLRGERERQWDEGEAGRSLGPAGDEAARIVAALGVRLQVIAVQLR